MGLGWVWKLGQKILDSLDSTSTSMNVAVVFSNVLWRECPAGLYKGLYRRRPLNLLRRLLSAVLEMNVYKDESSAGSCQELSRGAQFVQVAKYYAGNICFLLERPSAFLLVKGTTTFGTWAYLLYLPNEVTVYRGIMYAKTLPIVQSVYWVT